MYDTYRFKDKDPIIDIVRTCVEIFAATRNVSFAQGVKHVSLASGVSQSCIWAWFAGHTKYPRFSTIMAVVYATGRDVHIDGVSGHIGGSKPRFRVIKGGRGGTNHKAA
jgi:hypothetical protein